MLNADVFILHLFGLLFGSLQGFVGGLADIHLFGVAPAAGNMGQRGHLFHHGAAESGRVNIHAGEQLRDQAVFLPGQRGQQMLRLECLILIFNGKALGTLQGLHGFLGETTCIHNIKPPLWKSLKLGWLLVSNRIGRVLANGTKLNQIAAKSGIQRRERLCKGCFINLVSTLSL